MKTFNASSFSEIEKILGVPPRSNFDSYFYRGISSEHILIPSIAYDWVKVDLDLLPELHEIAHGLYSDYIDDKGFKLSNYEKIFFSRHAGLISPYIDITKDITIALQFGIESAKSDNKPMHLYVFNESEWQRIEYNGFENMDRNKLTLMRRHMVLRENRQLAERTQFIQMGDLLSQSFKTLTTPLNQTYPNCINRVEILPEHFDTIKDEVVKRYGVSMDKDLLIDRNDEIFETAKLINQKAIDELKKKYNIDAA